MSCTKSDAETSSAVSVNCQILAVFTNGLDPPGLKSCWIQTQVCMPLTHILLQACQAVYGQAIKSNEVNEANQQ